MENKEFTITADLLASRAQRFLNFIMDFLIVYIIWISLGTTVIIIGEITSIYALSNWAESTTTNEKLVFLACHYVFILLFDRNVFFKNLCQIFF